VYGLPNWKDKPCWCFVVHLYQNNGGRKHLLQTLATCFTLSPMTCAQTGGFIYGQKDDWTPNLDITSGLVPRPAGAHKVEE
jgi:hypothetical protein